MDVERKGWKNFTVTVSKKSIAISTALGEFVDQKADIYECDNVFAIKNSNDGEYPIHCIAPNSNRKLIYSRPLARYIKEKYNKNSTINIPAWENNGVILFCLGDAGKNKSFHEGFTIASDTNRFRYENSIKILNNNLVISSCLSNSLTNRFNVYEYKDYFAFVCDRNGLLHKRTRNNFGTSIIKNETLTFYIKNKLKTSYMYGTTIPKGIIFTNDQRFHKKEDYNEFQLKLKDMTQNLNKLIIV